MIKRWPRRREFLSYYLLLRVFGDNEFSLAEAVELLLPLIGSRRVAVRLVKRLVKQGFLERVRPMVYRAKPLTDILDEALRVYFTGRLRRRNCLVEVEEGVKLVENCNLDKRVREILGLSL